MIRELHSRTTPEGDLVILSWNDETDSLELRVEPVAGEPLSAAVAKERAMDAFHHPFVYLPR